MSYQRIEILPSGIVSSSGATGWVPVPTLTMLEADLNITAVTGTGTPNLDAYLEAADDKNGTGAYPIFYDQQGAATATAADVSANTNKRNINGTSAAAAAGAFRARYNHVPAGWVRLRYVVSGTFTAGQGFTVSAVIQGK